MKLWFSWSPPQDHKMLPSAARSKHTKPFDQLNKSLVSYWWVTGCLMSLNGHSDHRAQFASHTGTGVENSSSGRPAGQTLWLSRLGQRVRSSESPVPLPWVLPQITQDFTHMCAHTHTHTHTATETWSHWKWEPSVTTTGTLSRAKTSATAHHQRHAWGSLLQGNRTKLLVWPWHRKMWEFYFWIQPFPSWYSSTQISVLNKVAARNWSVRFEFRSLWPHSHSDILVFSGMFPPKFMGHLNYNKERNCFVS